MKRKILLFLGAATTCLSLHAQKITAYAITAPQKGMNNWSEVRLLDIGGGNELQSVYQSAQQVELLNARTGKPITKKEVNATTAPQPTEQHFVQIMRREKNGNVTIERKLLPAPPKPDPYQPFATFSAACAYDKKHDRLYYTPMGINELRYIDLKRNNKIFYFQDVPFGALSSPRDVANQITRMVFGSDGNGYALTNNGNHLIQFTTAKKAVITDLGALTDDAANGANSVHSSNGYGGDMVADAKGNLYLVTANHAVFKISLETKVATYQGVIKGLPRSFSTNGAIVEAGSKVIVCSSNSTQGYYRFDLGTLQAEALTTGGPVYNASDLANGNLAYDKEPKEEKKEQPILTTTARIAPNELALENRISVYPNPVTTGLVKLSFTDQPTGKYVVQFMEISGKIVNSQQYSIINKVQVEEFKLPELIAKGNYVMRIVNEANQPVSINKLVVQ